jgi:hypothetical protein
VRNIDPYDGDALTLYSDIAAAKRASRRGQTMSDDGADEETPARKQILTALRETITTRYQAYSLAKKTLEQMTPHGAFTEAQREALNHCYDGPTKPLDHMKTKVLRAMPYELGTTCPYCGIGEVGTAENGDVGEWDHYLPRKGLTPFVEFAAHPLNLIPCCGTCNTYKGDNWIEDGQRLIVNVYHDEIDQTVPLIEADIDLSAPEPSVRFRSANLPEARTAFARLLHSHFTKLHLFSRYRGKARTEIPDICEQVRRNVVQAPDVLNEKAEDERRRRGINSWKAVLYRAASRSRELIDYCVRTTPQAGARAEGLET